MNLSAYAIVLLSSFLPCVNAFVPGIRSPAFRMPPRQAEAKAKGKGKAKGGGIPSKEKKLIGYPAPEVDGPPQIPDSGMPQAAAMREAFNQRMREEWEAEGRPKIFIKEDYHKLGDEGRAAYEGPLPEGVIPGASTVTKEAIPGGVIPGASTATRDEVKMVVQDEKVERDATAATEGVVKEEKDGNEELPPGERSQFYRTIAEREQFYKEQEALADAVTMNHGVVEEEKDENDELTDETDAEDKKNEVVEDEKDETDAEGELGERPEGQFKITIVKPDGGESSFYCPGDTYILDAADEAGIELPASCRSGSCGVCAGKLISGEVDQEEQTALEEDQVKAGYVMLCVASPLGDVKVRTEVEAELS